MIIILIRPLASNLDLDVSHSKCFTIINMRTTRNCKQNSAPALSRGLKRGSQWTKMASVGLVSEPDGLFLESQAVDSQISKALARGTVKFRLLKSLIID